MNKKILCLFFFAGCFMQAQESDSLPPPKPPFVHNAPATAAWTVTYKPKKAKPAPTPAKGGGPVAAAQNVPRELKAVQFFKAGNKRRVVYYWSDGTKNEKWLVNGAIYVEQPGDPDVREISGAMLPVMTPDLETYSDTDFPEFRWIQAAMYVPESAARDPSGQNRPHYLFRSIPQPVPAEPNKPAKPSKPSKNDAEQAMRETYKFFRGKRKKNNSGSFAWIDAATQLPIAFDDGVNMQFYSFDPNPPASLEMPERFAEAMTRKKKITEELARDKMQAN
jgi:hypothetical protein